MIGGRSLVDEVNHVKNGCLILCFIVCMSYFLFCLYEDVSMNEI